MSYETIAVVQQPHALHITIARPDDGNSINQQLLLDLNRALDEAERDRACRLVILQGANGVFCTGMDLMEATRHEVAGLTPEQEQEAGLYMGTLRRMSTTAKVVIARVDGKVIAGGIGFVAAADLVVATSRSTFSLPETLWGLLPANVIPYLIRRVGFQSAYAMALTTQTLTADEARRIQLCDALTDDPDDYIRRIMLRITRIEEGTIRALKAYFRRMWIVDAEMEAAAVSEFARLATSPDVQSNIRSFVQDQALPWQKAR